MVKNILVWSAAACLVTASFNVAAQDESLVPHWTAETHLRLAQCFVAEADEAADDWTAIAYAMKNWLAVRHRVAPTLRYVDMAKTICSVHKIGRRGLTRRQQWIRGLSFPQGRDTAGELIFQKPESFPARASWKRKKGRWEAALMHADAWRQGRLQDPCKGKAVTWGAPRDPNNKWHLPEDDPIARGDRVVRLACSDQLSNDFYRLMTSGERAALRAATSQPESLVVVAP